jgi:hypothetical protein
MEERRGANRVLVGNLKERDHLKDLGEEEVDNSKNRFFKKWDGKVDWIELAEDRDRWRALVNAVMLLLVP